MPTTTSTDQSLTPLPHDWQERYNALKDELYALQKEVKNPIQKAEKSAAVAEAAFLKLMETVKDRPFADKQEEVAFYKQIKPDFESLVIFYKKLFQIEIDRPPGSQHEQEAYLQKVLQKLQDFFIDNKFIYQYLRSGLTYLDEGVFFHSIDATTVGIKMYNLQEPTLRTSFDILVARVKANDLLIAHLLESLEDLRNLGPDGKTIKPTLTWTSPKVALIELAYAFSAAGVFNNGKAELREIIEGLQNAFQVDLGNYPRTMQEILYRKSGYTVFQDNLKNDYLLYIQRIEDRHIR